LPGTGTATVVPWILIVFSISIPSDIPLRGPKQVIKPIHLALLHGLLEMLPLLPDLQQQHTEKLRKKKKMKTIQNSISHSTQSILSDSPHLPEEEEELHRDGTENHFTQAVSSTIPITAWRGNWCTSLGYSEV
jgi:hypothetical protein